MSPLKCNFKYKNKLLKLYFNGIIITIKSLQDEKGAKKDE